MQKTLGLLITSDRNGTHLEAIVRAALRKRVTVRAHISGLGVKLCLRQGFQAVLAHAQVTICRRSAERLGLRDQIEALTRHVLTSSRRPPLNIIQCDRCLVL